VAILSVLVTLAAMSWLDYLPKNRVNAAMDELFTEMQRAKMRAISENRKYRITFNTTNSNYTIEYNNAGTYTLYKTVVIPNKNESKSIILGRTSGVPPVSGSSTSAVTFTGNILVFNTKGLPETNAGAVAFGGTVYLRPEDDTSRQDRNRAVKVASTGRIQAVKYTGTQWK